MLIRGNIFKVELREDRVGDQDDPVATPVTAWATIAPHSKAIAIGGDDGMSVLLSFPSESSMIINGVLKLRERPLIMEIDENSYKAV